MRTGADRSLFIRLEVRIAVNMVVQKQVKTSGVLTELTSSSSEDVL